MDSAQGLMAQLDALFHPKSVAVVGVPKGMKTGRLFLMALLDQGYPGHIYPVNPHAKEIDGLKVYPSVAGGGYRGGCRDRADSGDQQDIHRIHDPGPGRPS